MKSKLPPNTIESAVSALVDARVRGMRARFAPRDPNAEKPADVANAFVGGLVERLQSLGPIKFRKSKRDLFYVRGDFEYVYHFQSSHENIAGATIRLMPHALVQSKALKDWRRHHPRPGLRTDDGLLIGAMLGNLLAPRAYIDIELIEPETRSQSAELILDLVCAVDSTLRSLVASPENLREYALNPENHFVCMPLRAAEYLAATMGMDIAVGFCRAILETSPDGVRHYLDDMERLEWNGGDINATKWRDVRDITRFSLAYDLKIIP